MIRVTLAPEPPTFQAKVREPGLRALAEMVGEVPPYPRKAGNAYKKIADNRKAIPPGKLPSYWTEALDDMMSAYRRMCAYTGFRISPITGGRTVDHMVPKSRQWDKAYEWANYRLACSLVNTRKREFGDVLDPVEIEDGWFQLELVGYQVVAAPGLPAAIVECIHQTIKRLVLNGYEARSERERHVRMYENGMAYSDFEEESPFVARELRRQGKLRKEDA